MRKGCALALTNADSIEIDFALEDGRVLTAWLGLDGQEAQKSHGLCLGKNAGHRESAGR